MFSAFRALLERLRSLISGDEAESSLLRADWLLLSSFLAFPDVPAMTEVLRQAAALFSGRRSRVVFPDSPWCYGIYSPVAAFHRAAGAAEREAAELEEYFALYARLTGGHGSGADILFRAEYAYYAGNTQEAEILAYKAAFVAQSKRQTIIQLASTFYLAWIATMKGDSAGWRNAFDALLMTSPDLIRHSFVTPATGDIVRAMLLLSLGIEDVEPPEWIREGDFSEDLQPDLAEQRMKAHFNFLLSRRNFARLVGTAEAAYPEGITVECFGTMYLAFVTAAGYLGLNNRALAMELVRRAVAFALPSELYVQMVIYNQLTDGLIEECIIHDHPEHTARFRTAKQKMLSPLASIYKDMSPEELPESLTERERAVAVRAAQGLSNEEIASQLFVSVNTVRTHLRAAFRKLDIDRRAKLAEKLR
jgi:LuxR family maltose regulon positive regulatory protein